MSDLWQGRGGAELWTLQAGPTSFDEGRVVRAMLTGQTSSGGDDMFVRRLIA